ncbi:hypothetical protein BOX15_Mlig011980g1, partial [Macrostomum lignano]
LQPEQGAMPGIVDDYQLPPMCQKVEQTVEPLQTGLEKIGKRLDKCAVKQKPDEALAEAFRLAGDNLGAGAPQLSCLLQALYEIESSQLRSRAHMYEQLTAVTRDKFKPRENTLKAVSKQKRDINKLTEDLAKTKKRLAQQQQQQPQTQQQQQAIEDLRADLSDKVAELRRQRDVYSENLMSVAHLHSECCSDLQAMLRARLAYHQECAKILAEKDRQLEAELARISRTSGPCYRIDLDEHLKTTERQIAYVLEVCVRALNKPAVLVEEGLFRTNGSASSVQKLESFLNLMQAEENIAEFEPSAICGALKKYLKQLPVPLIGSGKLIDRWLVACQLTDQDRRSEALLACCQQLESTRPHYYRNLRYLIKFLVRVAALQDKNKMSPKNLGICIGPNIFYSCGQASQMSEMDAANTGSQLIEYLIGQHEKLLGLEEPDFGAVDSPLECRTPTQPLQSPLLSPQRLLADSGQPQRPPPPRKPSLGTISLDSVDGPAPPAAAKNGDSANRPQRPKPPPLPSQNKQQQQPESKQQPSEANQEQTAAKQKQIGVKKQHLEAKQPEANQQQAEVKQKQPKASKQQSEERQQQPQSEVKHKQPKASKQQSEERQQQPQSEVNQKQPEFEKQHSEAKQPEANQRQAEVNQKQPEVKKQQSEAKPQQQTEAKRQTPPQLPRRPQQAAESSQQAATPAAPATPSRVGLDGAFQLPRPSGPPPPPPPTPPAQLQPQQLGATDTEAPPAAASPSVKKRAAPQPPRPPPPSVAAAAAAASAASAAAPPADSSRL